METVKSMPDCTPNGQKMFVIVRDKHNVEHKVVNFNNPEMVPNKGLIVIEALRKHTRHQTASMFRCYRDPITEIIWGLNQGLTDQGDIFFKGFEWNDIRQYDLSIADDRKEWAIMQYHPSLLGSPYAKGKPAFKKLDVEKDAKDKIKNVGEKETAYAILKNLSHLQMIDMARDCGGIDTKNSSMAVIQGALYDFIDQKKEGGRTTTGAEDFNRIWTMTNRASLTVFKRCLLLGLVHLDLNSGYLWKKATPLGNSEATAIDYITKNPSLLMTMDTESKLMDNEFQMNATAEEKTAYITNQPAISKDVDSEMSKYMKRMEEKSIAQDEKYNKLMELLSKQTEKEVITPEAKFQEPSFSEDDLEKLKQEAVARGMKHTHLIKDKVKLQEWIDTHEIVTV